MNKLRPFSAFRFIHRDHNDAGVSLNEVINIRGRYDAIRRMGTSKEQRSLLANDNMDYRDGRGRGGKLLFGRLKMRRSST